jgi:hypothetical protein
MAVPIPGINAYTHNYIVGKATDTVYQSSPAFIRLSKRQRNSFRGGLLVQRPIIIGKLAGAAVGPGEGAPPQIVTTESALQVSMRLYLVNVPLLGFNAMANDGDMAVFKEVDLKFANASAEMAEMLAQDLYLTSSTLGRSRNIIGLEEWVDDGNLFASIGGITRANIAAAGTILGMNAFTSTLTSWTLKDLNRAMTQSWVGTKHVDLVIATRNGWDLVWNSLQPMQQVADVASDVAKAGFNTVRVNQAEVVMDPYAPTGTSGRMWGLCSEGVEWYFAANPLFNFGFTGFKGTQLGIDTAGQFLAGTTLVVPGARTCFKITSTSLF